MTFKSCGDCNMCCKLPEIPSIKKQSFDWCNKCDVGKGCKIYNDRPKKCKDLLLGRIISAVILNVPSM